MRRFVSPAGRRTASEEGLTLIEIIIAGFVLSVAVLGLASVASTSLVSIRDSRERDRATAAASSALEEIRALDYDEIALRVGATDWPADVLVQPDGGAHKLDHDGDGLFTETIWAAPAGELHPYACTSESANCWFDMPEATRLEVRTFVSWYPNATEQSAKRVTVVATWVEPSFSAPRVVRMSSLVSPAIQGLPAPAFEVLPKELTSSVDQIAVDDEHEECFAHAITNYGSIDTYDIQLPASENWVAWNAANDGTWRNIHWTFRAFFVRSGESLGDATLMKADVEGATFNVVSPVPLDTGESAQMYLCYSPRGVGDDGGTKPTPADSPFAYRPMIRSTFDPNVNQEVANRLDVVAGGLRLFLHFDQEAIVGGSYVRPTRGRAEESVGATYPGGTSTTASVLLLERFPMNPLSPPPVSLPHYDEVVRFDGRNITVPDRLQRPGLFLPPTPLTLAVDEGEGEDGVIHPAEAFAAEWDWEFDDQTAPVTFSGASTINIWATRHGSSDAPPKTARFCVRTQVLKYEKLESGALAEEPVVLADATQDFQATGPFRLLGSDADDPAFTIPWSNGSEAFKPGDVLRLRIWNTGMIGDSDLTCVRMHIGFGADTGSGTPTEYLATLNLWP